VPTPDNDVNPVARSPALAGKSSRGWIWPAAMERAGESGLFMNDRAKRRRSTATRNGRVRRRRVAANRRKVRESAGATAVGDRSSNQRPLSYAPPMFGSFRKPGARYASAPFPSARCRSGRWRAVRVAVLSMVLLGIGCGENVLVGNLQLDSLSDAGVDVTEVVELDAGLNLQALKAERARQKEKCKQEGRDHCDDKKH
jgi:hypothetical protein